MTVEWNKLSQTELLDFLSANSMINDEDTAKLLYDVYLKGDKNIKFTPPVEDLILASKFTKPIKQNSYLESDLRKMTADKAQLFAKTLGIPTYDPNLKDRIIRILRYKGALKPEYYSPKKLAVESNLRQQVESLINQLPDISNLKNNADQNAIQLDFRKYTGFNVKDATYYLILKVIIEDTDNFKKKVIFSLLDKYPAVNSYLLNNNIELPDDLDLLTLSGDYKADEETAKKIITAFKPFINIALIKY